jgi:hypothetical protein
MANQFDVLNPADDEEGVLSNISASLMDAVADIEALIKPSAQASKAVRAIEEGWLWTQQAVSVEGLAD